MKYVALRTWYKLCVHTNYLTLVTTYTNDDALCDRHYPYVSYYGTYYKLVG